MCMHMCWCVWGGGGRGCVWPTLLSVDMPCHYALRHMLTLEHTNTHTHTRTHTCTRQVLLYANTSIGCHVNTMALPLPFPLPAAVVLALQLSLLVSWALRRAGKRVGLRGSHFFAHCRECYRTHVTPLLVSYIFLNLL